MLSFFVLLFFMGGLGSLLPYSEIIKIIVVLFSIPIILFLSVKWSKQQSTWVLSEHSLTITFGNKTFVYPIIEIDHIRNLTRSGGSLLVIYPLKKRPSRYWRNKLFQGEDDSIALHNALTVSEIEYFKF